MAMVRDAGACAWLTLSAPTTALATDMVSDLIRSPDDASASVERRRTRRSVANGVRTTVPRVLSLGVLDRAGAIATGGACRSVRRPTASRHKYVAVPHEFRVSPRLRSVRSHRRTH